MNARRLTTVAAALALALAVAGPAMAAKPDVTTWTNQVDAPYFDCGSFVAHGVWSVSHVLKTFFAGDGTPTRDIEQMSFTGSFVNPDTGTSIRDSGKVEYFDVLAPDYSYVSTAANVLRHSDYFKVAGRTDRSGTFHGVDRFDVNIPAACAALGA
jgi:hypothetical protein